MSTEAENVDTGPEVTDTESDKINTGALGTLVAVGLFAMISITAAVTALVRHDLDIAEGDKALYQSRAVNDLKASQRGMLNAPAGYLDKGKGVVSLPIDVARGLVVGELARDPSSATPPASASAANVQVTPPAVDSGAAAATLPTPAASGSAAAPKPGAVKAEQGREVLAPAPGAATRPSPMPTPTPTAGTPGQQSPGPTPTDSKR